MFALINFSYLTAAVCFILGIKGMTRPPPLYVATSWPPSAC